MGNAGPGAELASVLDVLKERGLVATRIRIGELEVQLGAVEVPRTEERPELTPEEQQREYERVMYASADAS